MIRVRSIGIALALATVSTAAMAEGTPLAGSALRKTVVGKTYNLHTAVGVIPVSFRGDGSMSGTAKSLPAYVGPDRDSGSWWISGNQLCQRWGSWLQGRQHCFTVRISGRTLHWRSSDGQSGIATLAQR